jgi:acyl-CoA reductase-like NAD-dependent aldehyde dehydrogenase
MNLSVVRATVRLEASQPQCGTSTVDSLPKVWTYRVRPLLGGARDSGFGRERGQRSLLEFTAGKNVMMDFSGRKRDPFAVKA